MVYNLLKTFKNYRCDIFLKIFTSIKIRRLVILGLLSYILYYFYYFPNNFKHLSEKDFTSTFYSNSEKHETLSWVVMVDNDEAANSIAAELGLINKGKVGQLSHHYLFVHPLHEHGLPGVVHKKNKRSAFTGSQSKKLNKDWLNAKQSIHQKLSSHPQILHFDQQKAMKRVKRYEKLFSKFNSVQRSSPSSSVLNNPINLNDPLFSKQWHLKNLLTPNNDVNVTGVWMKNITGRNITIAVVDDGLDWRSPDIMPNYNPAGSFDLVSNDDDPSPSKVKETNHHGTRCAGEIAAAANNSFCGVGVAFGARVSGIRLIEGPMTDEAEARAFTEKLHVNDVYSCSWGPDDDGKTFDGPHRLAQKALRVGTDHGRGGYGSIYVVASGNGGRNHDNCNYDGYANSVYTVTVGAVDEFGMMPPYSEECASMLGVAYSSGSGSERTVVTADWSMYGGSGCTENHSGTSAAAPLAAGIVALMLEARPCLTWRDVQHLIVLTAVKVDAAKSSWTRNGAGLHHSHQHGFGVMDAWRLVNAAKVWRSVPWMTSFSTETNSTRLEIRSGQVTSCAVNVSRSDLELVGLNTLEYVHLILTFEHEFRGQVEVNLKCPSGTGSVLGATRPLDDSKEGLKNWVFSTVRCWGEEGHGWWKINVVDHGTDNSSRVRGQILNWRLQLYGSSITPQDISERIRLSLEASNGDFLDPSFQLECRPPPVRTQMERSVSNKYLKILLMVGIFCVLMALSDTIEYAFCFDKETNAGQSKLGIFIRLARAILRAMGKKEGASEGQKMEEEIETAPLLDGHLIAFESVADELTEENIDCVDGTDTTRGMDGRIRKEGGGVDDDGGDHGGVDDDARKKDFALHFTACSGQHDEELIELNNIPSSFDRSSPADCKLKSIPS